ncbi:MAG: CDF family Co(II)/Ni(II) efflux transporter DmeF [Proteobacteria bacterium]|nr:CDF family Co(II)/Ni(II) efflux transporter DmeF [Pseudomonadota bacterium]
MPTHNLKDWQHPHDFTIKNKKGERRTHWVLILTAVTMVVEIVAGSVYGSMALLADGWHMGTHVAAFVITIFAYRYTRKHAHNPAYAFGTGKVNVLGGFASAVALAVVALVMSVESLQRIIHPQVIHFNEAIVVAVIGLGVNLVSAFLLKDNHEHDPHHDNDHHHDHNLKAAYFHVLADALTSLLAIVALASGKYFGWDRMDPIMGIVGALIITRWSFGLMKQTSPILLDASIGSAHHAKIMQAIEQDPDNRISDLHVWNVGGNHYAAIISIVTHFPKPTEHYKKLLSDFSELSHISIEINECKEEPCSTVS